MKAKNLFSIVLFLLLSVVTFSQSIGDYRSVSTGNYTALATWQRFNGTNWTTPTTAQGFPGQFAGTGNVTIQSGHTVTIGTAGITTQPMGSFFINSTGRLYLTGTNRNVDFNLNTLEVYVLSTGSIYFFDKSTLALPLNAVINVTTGGLTGDGCNNNKIITIDGVRFAVCAGAPGSIYTFEQLMSMGGTLNALPTSNSPVCQFATLEFYGDYSGAIGTAPTYSWSITNPSNVITTFTTQNVSIPNAITGQYNASLTVTSNLNGTNYSNSETIIATVNPLPTLSGVSQPITVCPGSGAIINLTGLVPNNTFEVTYSIAGGSPVTVSGLTSSPSGTSSFVTASPLVLGNNGQTLTISSIRITNPSTNCSRIFTSNNSVVLSVFTTGSGTWTGKVSSDWHNAANWCGGIPDASTDVIIQATSASVPNQPVISSEAVCRNITINASASLTITGTNILDVKGNWTNNGTFTANQGMVVFSGSVLQNIYSGANYYGLKITNSAGVKAGADIFVDGVLDLAAVNPNETNGLLEMTKNYGDYSNVLTPTDSLTTRGTRAWDILDSWILYMGANATTIGQGDVTGKVKRTTIAENVEYTFGSQFSSVTFNRNTTGTIPTDIMFVITKGSERGIHANKTNTVKRLYQIIRTGGSLPTTFSVKLRYLDSELNGNKKDSLVLWDHHIPYSTTDTPHEHGKSSQSLTENWVSLIGHGINYLNSGEVVGGYTKYWMFANSLIEGNQWLGAVPSQRTVWNHASNWSKGNIPTCSDNVIIPPASLVPYAPVLPENATVGTITIQEGGVLDGGSGTLTICGGIRENGGSGSWSNYGTFNPGDSHVILNFERGTLVETATLSGSANFNNLTINNDTYAVVQLDARVDIKGTFVNDGYLDAASYQNSFEYSGDAAQTIVNPILGNAGYYDLILSGDGAKTFPESVLDIKRNLTLNAAVLTTGNTLVFSGNVPQLIDGTESGVFNHVTINNAAGIALENNLSVNGTLTLTNGIISTGSSTLTVGCNGTITRAGTASYIDGKLSRVYCGTGSKLFPIGKDGNYRPATLEFASLSGTSTVTMEQFESTIPGNMPVNTFAQQGRYWSITQSGGSDYDFSLTLDGSPFALNGGEARIVSGDGESNTAHVASYSSPEFTASSLNSFRNFAVASDCVAPVITVQPIATSVCDGSNGIISVEATGVDLSYQWQLKTDEEFVDIQDDEIYDDVNTSTLKIMHAKSAMHGNEYRVIISRNCGSEVISNTAALTINALPTIELATDSIAACRSSLTVELPYNSTTESPDKYRIDFDDVAQEAGFVDVELTDLTANTIVINLPDAVGSFNANFYVYKTSTGCESLPVPFSIHLIPLPQGSLSGNTTCSGSYGQLTWNATSGTGPFTIVYHDGVDNRTATNVSQGVPFNTHSVVTVTTEFSLVSVTGASGCARTTGFDGAQATVTVSSGIWHGSVSEDWNNADNWCGGIPTETTDVLIPANAVRQPVICNLGAVTRDMIVEGGASVSISDIAALSINGDFYNLGTINLNKGKVNLNKPEVGNRGMIYTKRNTPDALPKNKNWGEGAVVLNAPEGVQTLVSGIFSDLIIDSKDGVELDVDADVEVNERMSVYRGRLTVGSGRKIAAERVENLAGSSGILISGSSGETPNGTLIFGNSIDEPVMATVSMYSKAAASTYDSITGRYSNYKWQFFGIPVRSVAANPTFAGSFIRRYDETVPKGSLQWISLVNSSVLESFRPYQITQAQARTVTFSGILENRDTVIQLSYTAGGNFPGQNLIANPYAAAIGISNLTFGDATEQTVYLYNTGSYADWALHSTYGDSPGQYVSIPKQLGDPSIPSGLPWEIPSMQAFLVKKKDQNAENLEAFTIGINYAASAIKGTTPQRVRSSSAIDKSSLPFTKIEVSGARVNDRMWIFDVPGCTREFDNGWDGMKVFGPATAAQIYAAEESGNYQVNSVDQLDGSWIGFRPGQEEFYTITFEHRNRSVDRFNRIYLTDLQTGISVDISESGSSYQFRAVPGSPAARRFLISQLNNQPGNNVDKSNLLELISQSGNLFVDNKSRQQGNLVIYNISGTPVYNTNFKGNGRTLIKTNLVTGIYLVEAIVPGHKVQLRVLIEK